MKHYSESKSGNFRHCLKVDILGMPKSGNFRHCVQLECTARSHYCSLLLIINMLLSIRYSVILSILVILQTNDFRAKPPVAALEWLLCKRGGNDAC